MNFKHFITSALLAGLLACGSAADSRTEADAALLGLLTDATDRAAVNAEMTDWEARAIQYGDSVPISDDSERLGVVQVGFRDGADEQDHCTGTLITNSWVLTAEHCMSEIPAYDSLYVKLEESPIPDTTPTPGVLVGETVLPPTQYNVVQEILHPFQDIALLRLETPVKIVDNARNHIREIYPHPTDGLVGETVRCVGYGYYYVSFGVGLGLGELREASFEVAASGDNPIGDYTGEAIGFVRNENAQIHLGGDSGGPCFQDERLVSVLSGGGPVEGTQVSFATAAAAFRDWTHARVRSDLRLRTGFFPPEGPITIRIETPRTIRTVVRNPAELAAGVTFEEELYSDETFEISVPDAQCFVSGGISKVYADERDVDVTINCLPFSEFWNMVPTGYGLW